MTVKRSKYHFMGELCQKTVKICRNPLNTGEKRKPVYPEFSSEKTGCLFPNGGGGGSRTPVRLRVTAASTCLVCHSNLIPADCRQTGGRGTSVHESYFRLATRSSSHKTNLLSSPPSPSRCRWGDVVRIIYAASAYSSLALIVVPGFFTRPTRILDTQLRLQPKRRSQSPPQIFQGTTPS